MKLRSYETTKLTAGNVRIEATWSDKFKKPAKVTLKVEPADSGAPQKLLEGDLVETQHILFALAEIAWSQGWRPRGLPGFMAHLVTQYKIPPPE